MVSVIDPATRPCRRLRSPPGASRSTSCRRGTSARCGCSTTRATTSSRSIPRPAARHADRRSTTRTTCTSRPTGRRPSSWPRRKPSRLPRPAHDAAPVVAAGARLRGHQSRRLLRRRPLPARHLRVRGQLAKIDMVAPAVVGLLRPRHRRAPAGPAAADAARPMPQAGPTVDAARHPRRPRRPALLRRRHGGRRRARDRRRHASRAIGFIPTGIGAHGITPSRDGTRLYVANRGSDQRRRRPHGPGSVSVVDPATNTVVGTWPVPDGGSPDMGNISADGTRAVAVRALRRRGVRLRHHHRRARRRIPVGQGPHGSPCGRNPGSFSLGHTGNMR